MVKNGITGVGGSLLRTEKSLTFCANRIITFSMRNIAGVCGTI